MDTKERLEQLKQKIAEAKTSDPQLTPITFNEEQKEEIRKKFLAFIQKIKEKAANP